MGNVGPRSGRITRHSERESRFANPTGHSPDPGRLARSGDDAPPTPFPANLTIAEVQVDAPARARFIGTHVFRLADEGLPNARSDVPAQGPATVSLLVGKSPVRKRALPNEGGRFALAGFVHQMLGSAASLARHLSARGTAADPFFELEAYGQDESVETKKGAGKRKRVLTQYKVSFTGGKIDLSIARGIVSAFHESLEHAKNAEDIPTEFELCTNREQTDTAAVLLHQNCVAIRNYDPHQAENEIRAYAARLGIMEGEELERGIDAVIGRFFSVGASSASHEISRALFDEKLAGYSNPTPIAIPDACRAHLARLSDDGVKLELAEQPLAGRRAVLDTMGEWANEAIILFTGEGGCGKTTALWEAMRCVATGSEQIPGKLAAFQSHWLEPLHSLEALVAMWRGAPPPASSSTGDKYALKRLRHANVSHPHPILLLGLDGIDEIAPGNDSNGTARRLIQFFWSLHVEHMNSPGQPPPAQLLLTCRQPEEFLEFVTSSTGISPADPVTRPRSVTIGPFTQSEIEELVQEEPRLDPNVKRMILDNLYQRGSVDQLETFAGGLGRGEPMRSRWPELIRRPIIWRFFVSLTPEQQLSLMEGQGHSCDEGEDSVAREYLNWFLNRVNQRRATYAFERQTVREALVALAHQNKFPGVERKEIWNTTVTKDGALTRAQSQGLYAESASVGIIEKAAASPEVWRWGFEFLWRYLANGAAQ
jgi:hypothetical protein